MMTRSLSLAVLLAMAPACGDSTFSGDPKLGDEENPAIAAKGEDPERSGKSGGEGNGAPGKGDEPVQIEGDDLSEDDRAINKCLQKYASHPFAPAKVRNYRKVDASVSVLGAGSAIVDDRHTSEPELVLVEASVNVLSQSKMSLLNPNGFYCLKVNVSVKSALQIDLHCNARLADNKVNVGVGNSGEAAGQVGVNVFSDVRINRVGQGCGG